MSLQGMAKLTIEGAAGTFHVLSFRGRERVNAPFVFEVTCAPEGLAEQALDLGGLDTITAPAKLSWALGDDEERTVSGVIGDVVLHFDAVRFTLVARAALAEDAEDHRIFVDEDAVAIAEKVLSKHGLSLDKRLSTTPPKRAQVVQMFEHDLAFVSRILADEGIAWFCKPGDGKKLVLADRLTSYEEIKGAIRYAEGSGLSAGEHVYGARIARRLATGKVSLQDYDFEKPQLDQAASVDAGEVSLEHYEYPGGYHAPDVGKTVAEVRLEEARARRVVLTCATTSRRLLAGGRVTLSDGPRDDMNGEWLILEIEHEAGAKSGKPSYEARVTAVPGAKFRPPRQRAPRLGGVETTIVTGPSGGEIHTEAFGRAKVLHRWDREHPADDTASAWGRVVQPPTSGSIFLPRVGWEALVGFGAARGDDPIVLGRLYNATAVPPRGLPGSKVASAFGSQTTQKGAGGNLVAMVDTAGAEGMEFVASKDFNERTENDKVTAVTAVDDWKVGADRKLFVGNVMQEAVTGAQSIQVSASRTMNVGANLTLTGSSESILIGGLRYVSTGGDYATSTTGFFRIVLGAEAQTAIEHYNRFVQGASIVAVAGSWITVGGLHRSVGVLGGSMLRVTAAKNVSCANFGLKVRGALTEKYASRKLTVGGDIEESFAASGSYELKGASTFKGADVVFEATTSLTVKAGGGLTIEIHPSSIKITGQFKGDVASVEDGEFTYG